MPVSPGDKFKPSARVWNAFEKAANRSEGSIHDRLEQLVQQFNSSGIVEVVNRSGEQRGRFHVLGLGDTFVSPSSNLASFKNAIVLAGEMPSVDDHRGRFGICVSSIAEDAIGDVTVAGLAVCQIEVIDDNHPHADIETDEPTKLVSNWWGGAEIVYKESGTGTKWAVVRIGAFSTNAVVAKTNAAHAKGATGSVTVWLGSGADATESTSVIEDVYNRYGDVPEGLFVRVCWDNGGPELVAREC